MRIISGYLKKTKLLIPDSKTTRPLRDMVRENIFNLLAHSNKINFKFKESNILDLYAGTGSFGLECFSRGSKNVYFIENEKSILKILKKNIDKLKLNKKSKVISDSVINIIEKKNILKLKFDLIFVDPPFKDMNIEKLTMLIFKKKLILKDGIIILHRSKYIQDKLPSFFKIFEERIYGVSKIIFGKISL